MCVHKGWKSRNLSRFPWFVPRKSRNRAKSFFRSEEHTSELQSRLHLVCRPLLEKTTTHVGSPLLLPGFWCFLLSPTLPGRYLLRIKMLLNDERGSPSLAMSDANYPNRSHFVVRS